MQLLRWIFRSVFGRCRHRRLSRVFTIDKRTYRVCFECGRQFTYSGTLTCPAPSNAAENAHVSRNTGAHAQAAAPPPFAPEV